MNLYSKEWCDLIFLNRNKCYGAYQLRKEVGKRYAISFTIVLIVFTSICCIPFLLNFMYKQANKTLATEIQRLSKLDGTLVKEANRAIQKKQAATDAKKKPPTSFIPMPPAKQEVQWKGIITSISTTSPDIENISDSENSLKTDLDTDASLKDAKSTEQTIGKIVEEMPLYPGGIAALMKWLNKTIIYPAFCIRQNIEGNVEVTFIVNKDGSLSDFKVSKSVHAYLDSEALRVVRKMQKWIPGKHNGKVANVCITLPIEFKLN